MPDALSSAQPNALFRYADVAAQINGRLEAEYAHLAPLLQQFAFSCTEYRLGIDEQTAYQLKQYAAANAERDAWVHNIGKAFELADTIASSETAREITTMVKENIKLGLEGGALRRDISIIDDHLKEFPTVGQILRARSTDPNELEEIKEFKNAARLPVAGWAHLPPSRVNIAALTAEETLGHQIGELKKPLGAAFFGAGVALSGWENWQEFHNDGIATVAVGTVVDTALTTGLSIGGAAVGAAVFSAIIPIPGVGAVIGEQLGGMAGDKLAGWIEHSKRMKDIKKSIGRWLS